MTAPAATPAAPAPAPADVPASAPGAGPESPTPGEVRAEALAVLTGPAAGPGWQAFAEQRAAGEEPDPRPLFRLLGVRGLLAPAWPVTHGGRGLTARHAAAVVGALVEAGVPETLHTLSVQICGTFLRTAGSRAQQAALLPALALGERFATVLYSEPDVGSDLAALTTRAEPEPGGGWRLSGRKVYSVKTHCADVGLVAARTATGASRYQGITLFLVPFDAPGVDVRPLGSVADERFADVILDGVWVPDGAVVGPVGGAWPLVVDALALERTGVDYHAKAATWLGLWRAATPVRDAGQRVGAARHRTRVEAARLLSQRCLDQLDAGRVDPVLAATTKLWSADVARAVAWWCAEEAGPAALRRWPDPGAVAAGRLEAAYREAPGLTISAGTAEMMLELVAGSGLPAPDGDVAGLEEEPLARRLRRAVRAVAAGHDERDDPATWTERLAALGVFALDVPAASGGLGLGLPATVIACEELGRAALDGGVLDRMAGAGGGDVTGAGGGRAGAAGDRDRDRVRRAAWLTGLATGALAHTVRRARTRRQFDRVLLDNQDVAFRLADLAAAAVATRLLVEEAAAALDLPAGPDGARDGAGWLVPGTLAAAVELAYAATREAMQLHGAYGMTDHAPAQRYYLAAMAACGLAGPARALWLEAADREPPDRTDVPPGTPIPEAAR